MIDCPILFPGQKICLFVTDLIQPLSLVILLRLPMIFPRMHRYCCLPDQIIVKYVNMKCCDIQLTASSFFFFFVFQEKKIVVPIANSQANNIPTPTSSISSVPTNQSDVTHATASSQ